LICPLPSEEKEGQKLVKITAGKLNRIENY
jgi:hypothetical protein